MSTLYIINDNLFIRLNCMYIRGNGIILYILHVSLTILKNRIFEMNIGIKF